MSEMENQSNMKNQAEMKNQIIYDYVDGALHGKAKIKAEKMISADPAMKELYESLKLSVEAIRQYGLQQEITSIQNQYLASKSTTATVRRKPAMVRSMIPSALRVAASVLVVVGAAGLFKYAAVTTTDVYSDYYMPYEVSRVRSSQQSGAIEKAFIYKDWSSVTSEFSTLDKPGNQELFLAGIAYLESFRPQNAVRNFEKIIENNSKSNSDYFLDEAEYYLAVSYIKNQEAAKAIPLLKKIRANKDHLYHEKASEKSLLNLKVLKARQ